MWSYTKGHGLWLGVQVDGTVIVTRNDANSVFYNQRGITAKTILTGDVAWPMGAKPLFEMIRAMEGRRDVDQTLIQEVEQAPTPAPAPAPVLVPVDAPESPHLDEKAAPLPAYAEIREDNEWQVLRSKEEGGQDTQDQASDLYESSVQDEKERLAKSGF